ncbi:D-alanyl-D-alanine carboxypeptidase family protein [Eubacteriales bacterium KG127]
MKKIQITLIIVVVLIASFISDSASYADADQLVPSPVKVTVDGKNTQVIRAYYATYPNNLYVSLNDMAVILTDSSKPFDFVGYTGTESYDSKGNARGYNLTVGAHYSGLQKISQISSESTYGNLSNDVPIYINGEYTRYNTFNIGGEPYIKPIDLCMILNLDASMGENGIEINSSKSFKPTVKEIEKSKYFQSLHGAIVGDAETGKILFKEKSDNQTAIASTSKLMTYYLVKKAIKSGKVKEDEKILITKDAVREASSMYGQLSFKEGDKISVNELIEATLVASCNEACIALAEHVSGDVESFVDEMNSTAKKIGLQSAVFYNPNGLESHKASIVESHLDNQMNAVDMFRLACILCKEFPEITKITSKKNIKLENLRFSKTNTNPLLFNMDGVTGLKTGYTEAADRCLVALKEVRIGDRKKKILSVMFGAQSKAEQAEKGQMLMIVGEGVLQDLEQVEKGKLDKSKVKDFGSVSLDYDKENDRRNKWVKLFTRFFQ